MTLVQASGLASGPRPRERAADGLIAEVLVDPEHRSIRLVVLRGDEFDSTFGSVHEGRALHQQGEAAAAIVTQRPGHVGDRSAAWGDAEMREGNRSVIDDGRNARIEVRIRMTPIVLEPLLERDVVHRNLTGDVQHRLGVELVHLAWVERGEWAQTDAGRGAPGGDRARVDAGDPSRVGVTETVCGGELLRRLLSSGGREHCRDAEAG